MRWITSFALLLALACNGEVPEAGNGTPEVGGGGDAPAEKEDIGEVLAKVGDVVIGTTEFQAVAQRRQPAEGDTLSDDEKKEILQDLVDQKILYLKARDNGIDRDPKVQKLMIQTLMRQEVYSGVRNGDFSQDELRAYFEEHREDFVVPEKVQVKRIFVKSGGKRTAEEAKQIADEIHAELMSDPSRFKALATEKSEDPYRKRGGDLGFVSRKGKPGVPQEVTDKAFEVGMNEVSPVFESAEGFNMIKVTQRRERVERTFEQMKGSVLRKVKNERYKQLYDDFVANVRNDYPVDTQEDKLAGLEVKPPKRLDLGPGMTGFPNRPPGMGGGDGLDPAAHR
jgi:parvulin-like peptidyl-prolyl isomerase